MDAQMEKDYIKGGAFLIENRDRKRFLRPKILPKNSE